MLSALWKPLIPVAALGVNVLVHIIAVRVQRQRLPYLSVLVGFLAGAAASALATWSSGGVAADRWPMLAIAMPTYVALAYGYFAFANLSMTSLRIRLLQDIADAGGTLSEAHLRASYNDDAILELRLQRLLYAGQLVERDGRLCIGGQGFLWLAYLVDGLRLLVLGRVGTDSATGPP